MGELVRVEHLKKYFASPAGMLHAVDDVSFVVNERETLGVVGESGCGKSTLGRVILKLIEPTDGKIIFDGRDITDISKDENVELRKQMQIIFQDPYSSLKYLTELLDGDANRSDAAVMGKTVFDFVIRRFARDEANSQIASGNYSDVASEGNTHRVRGGAAQRTLVTPCVIIVYRRERPRNDAGNLRTATG